MGRVILVSPCGAWWCCSRGRRRCSAGSRAAASSRWCATRSHADVSIGDALARLALRASRWATCVVEPRADGKPGFSIGSITAKPALAALLRGRVEVPDLVVKHVTLNLTRPPSEGEQEEEEEAEEPEPAVPEAIPGFGFAPRSRTSRSSTANPAWDRPRPRRAPRPGHDRGDERGRDAHRGRRRLVAQGVASTCSGRRTGRSSGGASTRCRARSRLITPTSRTFQGGRWPLAGRAARHRGRQDPHQDARQGASRLRAASTALEGAPRSRCAGRPGAHRLADL